MYFAETFSYPSFKIWKTVLFTCMIQVASASQCFLSANIICDCDSAKAECHGVQIHITEVQDILANFTSVSNIIMKITNLQFEPSFKFDENFNVTNLTLGYGLQTPPSDFLLDLGSSLISLNLQNNSIKLIDDMLFSSLTNLRELFLDMNELSELESSMFKDLVNLKYLSIASNYFQKIAPDTFQNLVSLETLDLSHNNLSLFQNVNISSTNLTVIKIDGCGIQGSLEKDTFSELPKLEKLNLAYNELSKVEPNSLSALKNLKYLNLSHNAIEFLQGNAFIELNNLTHLDLKNNKIFIIKITSFTNLLNLEFLDLSGNRLKGFLCEYTTDFHHLKRLYLQDNEIKSFTSGTLYYSPHLQVLDLTGNHLECSCELTEISHYFVYNITTIKKDNFDSVFCNISSTHAYMPIMDYKSSKCIPQEQDHCKKIIQNSDDDDDDYYYDDDDDANVTVTADDTTSAVHSASPATLLTSAIATSTKISTEVNTDASITSTRITTDTPLISTRITTDSPLISTRITTDSPITSTRITTDAPLISTRMTTDSPITSIRITTDSSITSTRITTDAPITSTRITTDAPLISTRITTDSPITSSRITTDAPLISTRITTDSPITSTRITTDSLITSTEITTNSLITSTEITTNSSIASTEITTNSPITSTKKTTNSQVTSTNFANTLVASPTSDNDTTIPSISTVSIDTSTDSSVKFTSAVTSVVASTTSDNENFTDTKIASVLLTTLKNISDRTTSTTEVTTLTDSSTISAPNDNLTPFYSRTHSIANSSSETYTAVETTTAVYSRVDSSVLDEAIITTLSTTSSVTYSTTEKVPTASEKISTGLISTPKQNCSSLELSLEGQISDLEMKVIKNFSYDDNIFCLKWTLSGVLPLKGRCLIKYYNSKVSTNDIKCPSFAGDIQLWTTKEEIFKFCLDLYVDKKREIHSCAKTFEKTTSSNFDEITVGLPSLKNNISETTTFSTYIYTKTSTFSSNDASTVVSSSVSSASTTNETTASTFTSTNASTVVSSSISSAATTNETTAFKVDFASTQFMPISYPADFRVISFDLFFNGSTFAYAKWTVSKEEPLNLCNLTLTASTQTTNFDHQEGIFPCKKHTHQLKSVKDDDLFKICLVVSYKFNSNPTLCRHSLAGANLDAEASKGKDHSSSNHNASIIPLICLLILLVLIVIFIISKNLYRKKLESDRYDVRAEEEKSQRVEIRPVSSHDRSSVRDSYIAKENPDI